MSRRLAPRAPRRKTGPEGGSRRDSSPDGSILYRIDGPVAWVTLSRPGRKNALSGRMREDLLARIREAGSEPAVRVLVVTGAGDAFCAGGDISVMAEMKARGEDFEGLGRLMDQGDRIVGTLHSFPKPSLACLNGAAAGAGCNLALACDFRIASARAALGETFARVGLHPDWGGTYFLPRLIGSVPALEMFTTGEMMPADRALALGLVSRVVPPSRLVAETRALALRLAAVPPEIFLSVREAVRRSPTCSLPAMLSFERQAQRLCWESDDSAEGIRAFLEKRPPRFTGR